MRRYSNRLLYKIEWKIQVLDVIGVPTFEWTKYLRPYTIIVQN